MVVVKADDVTSPEVVTAINSLEEKAAERRACSRAKATVELSDDQTVAIVTMPITGEGTSGKTRPRTSCATTWCPPLGELDSVELRPARPA